MNELILNNLKVLYAQSHSSDPFIAESAAHRAVGMIEFLSDWLSRQGDSRLSHTTASAKIASEQGLIQSVIRETRNAIAIIETLIEENEYKVGGTQ